MVRSLLSLAAVVLTASLASAQSLGTFKWQLQPFCNVVAVNVTGVAGVYTVEGFDDQCGAPTRAPLTGVATPNPDGSIGFGLNIVSTPGGRGIQVDARIAIATLGGSWSDSAGNSGTFAFNTNTGGSPRPLPVNAPGIPPVFGLRPDGGFVAAGVSGSGGIPATGAGTRMMWHPAKAAFRAGHVAGTTWDDVQVGAASVAFGDDTKASGAASAAFGNGSTASGSGSVAFGRSVAAGTYSTALGTSTASGGFTFAAGYSSVASGGDGAVAVGMGAEASGNASTALGYYPVASGNHSVAIGDSVYAAGLGAVSLGHQIVNSAIDGMALGNNLDVAGQGSIVLGTRASTTVGARGSFVFGDDSTANTLQSFFPNEFKVRAAGGTFFYSNPDLTTGVRLVAGANAWSSLSDVNSKENFRELDSHDLLTKLASMSIREWNYKTQAAAIRHAGPTAQDFYAAFGLGEDPLRISTIDADGIALAGVSALARENATLKAEMATLRAELASLRAALVVTPSPR